MKPSRPATPKEIALMLGIIAIVFASFTISNCGAEECPQHLEQAHE